jgi:predicted RNase H-like nuclease (RuvC/YqgF family)
MKESLRKTVLKRDKYKCVYCGSEEDLQVDHKIPRKYGGSDNISNLVTACKRCNIEKNAKLQDDLKKAVVSISGWENGHYFEDRVPTSLLRDTKEKVQKLQRKVKSKDREIELLESALKRERKNAKYWETGMKRWMENTDIWRNIASDYQYKYFELLGIETEDYNGEYQIDLQVDFNY